jgi:anaerobic selenocysteine-containing dehydrogenase
VQVRSDHGAVTVPARITDDVARGTVAITSNWWHADFLGGLGTNALTGEDLTDVGSAPQFTVRAEVVPVSG